MLGRRARLGLIPRGPRTPGEWAIGYAADAVLGGVFGASTAYLITRTPPGNEVLKGAGLGAVLWAVTLSLGNLLRLGHLTRVKPAQMVSLLAVSILFGALQGAILGRIGGGFTTQSVPELVEPVGDARLW